MKKITLDKLLTFLAVFVSAATLFIIVYQTNLIRTQQYASVLPYIEMGNSGRIDEYKLLLYNNGLGPAFIEKVEVLYDGQVYDGDHFYFFQEVASKSDSFNIGYSNIYAGRLIPAGSEVELIICRGKENTKLARKWFGGDNAILKIEYKSIYGEKWISKGFEAPVKIDD